MQGCSMLAVGARIRHLSVASSAATAAACPHRHPRLHQARLQAPPAVASPSPRGQISGRFLSSPSRSMSSGEDPAASASTPSTVAAASAASEPAAANDPVVQYVVLRKDLWTEQGWPLGSVVAQACHASSAAMFLNRDDETTLFYISPENIDHMHKVVLETKGETQLKNLSLKLTEAGVKHKLWVEQPENYATCLATKPYRKSEVAQHFKKFNLCKATLS